MLLTDKAKEDFIKWSKKQIDLQIGVKIPNTMGGTIFHLNSNIEILPKRILNFLIIEWFDSVDIAIHTYDLKNKNFGSSIRHYDFCDYKTRKDAVEAAILKANELYNRGFKDVDMEAYC
jgi:hypothetical protein